MTYDFILMNPPYDKNLHLKIIEQSINLLTDDGILVNLSPIRWLQDPLAEYKKNSDWYKFKDIREKIDVLLEIDKFEGSEMFDIRSDSCLGIYVLKNTNARGFSPNKNNILEKVLKLSKSFLIDVIEKDKINGWRVRTNEQKPEDTKHLDNPYNKRAKYYLTHDALSYVYFDGKTEDGISWQKHKTKQAGPTSPRETFAYSIPFETKKSAINFEKSSKTTFYKYLHGTMKIDQHTPFSFLPWMGDCTNPRTGKKGYEGEWLDEDFRAYFGITDSEWEEIVETMKPYL